MPTLSKTRKDAAGQPIKPDTIYTVVAPYSAGHHAYNVDSRLRGDSDAVQTHPAFWAPEGIDPEELHRLRVVASTPPVFVDHSQPKPKPIPLERRAVAVGDFWSSDGTFVRRGQVLRDDHKVVQAHRDMFHRPPMPLEAA